MSHKALDVAKWYTILLQTLSALGLYILISVLWQSAEMALYGVSQQSAVDSAAALCIAYWTVNKIWRQI